MIPLAEPRVLDLHVLRRSEVTLAEALEAARGEIPSGHAVLYAPAALLLRSIGELNEDAWSGLDRPYEARFFAPEAELRWVEAEHDAGRAVLLAEAARALPGWEPGSPRRVLAVDRAYLVTPQRVEEVRDLGSGIPGFDRETERLSLAAREYLAEIDRHGNVGLLTERLTGFIATRIRTKPWAPPEIPPDWAPQR